MLKYFAKPMLALAAAFALAAPSVAEASAASTANYKVMKTVLKDMDVDFTEKDGKIVIKADDSLIVVMISEDEDSMGIMGCTPLGISRSNRAKACTLINELNNEYTVKFYLDSDGDLMVQVVIDFFDTTINKETAAFSIGRVVNGLIEGEKKLQGL